MNSQFLICPTFLTFSAERLNNFFFLSGFYFSFEPPVLCAPHVVMMQRPGLSPHSVLRTLFAFADFLSGFRRKYLSAKFSQVFLSQYRSLFSACIVINPLIRNGRASVPGFYPSFFQKLLKFSGIVYFKAVHYFAVSQLVFAIPLLNKIEVCHG